MGRRKLGRTEALYTRISMENDTFLRQICKKTGLSKTAFIDSHFDFIRDNIGLIKTAQLAKTRNEIPSKGRQASKRAP